MRRQQLFREAGYEGAKIEAIAAQAEVSVGTIYNYYRNKGDILVAIVSMEVNEVLNAGRGVVAESAANVGDAIDTLIGIYIEHSLQLSQQGDVAPGDGDLDAAARQPVRPDLFGARPGADRPDLRR